MEHPVRTASNNTIHPTAIVAPGARLGSNNLIGPFCYIGSNVTIGDGNRFEAYVAIGTPGEHRDYFREEPGPVTIGDANIFREYVAVTGGTVGITRVGSHVVLMRGAHLGHDVMVKDRAILSWNVLVAGHTIIGHGANLGLAAVIHQRRVIGAFAMIGMNSTVTRSVAPFTISYGSPSRIDRVNTIGLQRSGIADAELPIFEEWFRRLSRESDRPPSLDHPYSRFIDEYLGDCRDVQLPAGPA